MRKLFLLVALTPMLSFAVVAPHHNRGVQERDFGSALGVYIKKRECLRAARYNNSQKRICLQKFQQDKQKLYDVSEKTLTKPQSQRKTSNNLTK